jgi:hypothetical protein
MSLPLFEKITAAKRHSLKKSDFVWPEDESYPIDTLRRAKNARSRIVSTGGSPADIKKVWRRTHSRYPQLSAKREESLAEAQAKESLAKTLVDRLLE